MSAIGSWFAADRGQPAKIVWSVVLMAMAGGCYTAFAIHASPVSEDLRVAIRFRGIDRHNVGYRFSFSNSGVNSAAINAVALIEIHPDATNSNPAENIALCDKISEIDIDFASHFQTELLDVATGGKYLVHRPQYLRVNHISSDMENPIVIRSGVRKIVVAEFDVPGAKEDGTMVLCPAIGAIDAEKLARVAVCGGASITTRSTGSDVFAPPSQEFRILPRDAASRCPAL